MSRKSSGNRARTRAVRAEMAETGDNYTRAAAQTHESPRLPRSPGRPGESEAGDPAPIHVRKLLSALREELHVRLRAAEDLEHDGYRIVTGGPKRASDDEWEIHDARTGDLLAEGSGGPSGYDEAWARLSRGSWVERDVIEDDGDFDRPLPSDTVMTEGVPNSLSHALMEWLENSRTPGTELAAFTGWSVDAVEECRIDLGDALRGGTIADRSGATKSARWAKEADEDNPFPTGTDEHREHDLYTGMIADRDG